MDLLSHGVDEMWASFILTSISQESTSFIEDLQEIIVVYSCIQAGRILLDNAHDLSRGQSALSNRKQSVDEVILSQNSLLVGVKGPELIGQLRPDVFRRLIDLPHSGK